MGGRAISLVVERRSPKPLVVVRFLHRPHMEHSSDFEVWKEYVNELVPPDLLATLSFRIKKTELAELPHDFFGARIIVRNEDEIARLLGRIRREYGDDIVRIKDLIANPWDDGYQSIHINLIWRGIPAEIQLRTFLMDARSRILMHEKGPGYWRRATQKRN